MQNKNELEQTPPNLWMLFDPAYTLVSQALLESKKVDGVAILKPIGESSKSAMQMHIVIFSKADDPRVIYRGNVGAKRGGKLYLEEVVRVEQSRQQHLRVRMEFASKLLCVREGRSYRVPIKSIDLSAGGIAFVCPDELKIHEICEIVIPVTEEMLVLRMEILRGEKIGGVKYQYGARFLNVAHEEEVMLQQAIFAEQWRRGRSSIASSTCSGTYGRN